MVYFTLKYIKWYNQKSQNGGDFTMNYSESWQPELTKLLTIIEENIAPGFELTNAYNMVSYVVPFSFYPAGYHVDKNQPLPFISITAQKNHIAIYHMGIYTSSDLLLWFQKAYRERVPTKLDMGKSCIRLKNKKNIPYDLLAELVGKMTIEEWVFLYKKSLKAN